MQFIRDAGWVVFWVLGAGLASLWFAVQYVRTLEQVALLRLGAFATLTGVLGVLGTILGVQASVEFLERVEAKWVFMIGLRESLNNLVLALVFIVMDLLIVALWGTFDCEARRPVVDR